MRPVSQESGIEDYVKDIFRFSGPFRSPISPFVINLTEVYIQQIFSSTPRPTILRN